MRKEPVVVFFAGGTMLGGTNLKGKISRYKAFAGLRQKIHCTFLDGEMFEYTVCIEQTCGLAMIQQPTMFSFQPVY